MTAEQIRRSGNPAGAIDLCRDALARFPGHLSARVTLGWALLDLGRLQEAREEFQIVRQTAPDNFAAIRGLAQLHVLEENDPTYTPDLDAATESAAPVAVAPPPPPPARPKPEPVTTPAAPVAEMAVVTLQPAPVVQVIQPVEPVEPVVDIAPAAAPRDTPTPSPHDTPAPSPVVMRLESWLSRVEALRAAV